MKNDFKDFMRRKCTAQTEGKVLSDCSKIYVVVQDKMLDG